MGSDESVTIYAVSSGEYSDYSVHCLFEREEDAKSYIEHTRHPSYWDELFVEQFQFFPAGVVPVVKND